MVKITLTDRFIAGLLICLCLSVYIVTTSLKYYTSYIVIGQVELTELEESIISNDTENDREKRIQAISILGERNSGTTWMYEHLNECFNHSISVKRRLTRYKHWFQDESVGKIVDQTLVLAMFRNPYDWLEAMRKKPHHASNHLFLDGLTFLKTPWTMDRVGLDLQMENNQSESGMLCQENFHYTDIISCKVRPYPQGYFHKTYFSEHQPFYEMRNDGSGKPFDSIMDLREAKIQNFLNVSSYKNVFELWILQYEALVKYGTSELLREIELLTGVKAECIPSPAQDRRHRTIDQGMKAYVEDRLNWSYEDLVGYTKDGRGPSSFYSSTIFKKMKNYNKTR